MEKEDVVVLAQLLNAIKEAVEKLEKYYKKKDMENLQVAKKEILSLQKEIDNLL